MSKPLSIPPQAHYPSTPGGIPESGAVLDIVHNISGLATQIDREIHTLRAALSQNDLAENLIRCSLDMIISVDQQRRIIEFNPAAERVFGYAREEVLGRPVDVLYAEASRGSNVSQTALNTGFTGEVRNRKKNGEMFWSYVSASPLRDLEGRVVGLMGISRDITREREMEESLRQVSQSLAELNRDLEAKVEERTIALRQAYDDTLDALVLALDTREQATSGHSRRVAVCCLYLALECGVPTAELENLYRGAVLHDIGKIGIPDAILLKPAQLTPQERTRIEGHVKIGVNLLERIGYLSAAADIPRFHHERFDGRGYPHGLCGAAIPRAARIFSIIDVYDALRSARPYKAGMSHDSACAILLAERGQHFDPEVLDCFMRLPAETWGRLERISARLNCFQRVHRVCSALRSRRQK